MELHERLEKLREASGLNAAEVSRRLRKRGIKGASKANVAKWFAGDIPPPRLDAAIVLAEILGVSMDAMRTGDQGPQTEAELDAQEQSLLMIFRSYRIFLGVTAQDVSHLLVKAYGVPHRDKTPGKGSD